jgi:hypothetical protein
MIFNRDCRLYDSAFLTAVITKSTIVLALRPCRSVKVHRCFVGIYRLHNPEDGGDALLRNVGGLLTKLCFTTLKIVILEIIFTFFTLFSFWYNTFYWVLTQLVYTEEGNI